MSTTTRTGQGGSDRATRKSSDQLLIEFAQINDEKTRLRRQRADRHCLRAETYGPDKPTQDEACWKKFKTFDEDHEAWVFRTEKWCTACRARQEVNNQLRVAARRRVAALRGLLSRGRTLLKSSR